MGNSLCAEKEKKKPKEYYAKQNISLFYTDEEHNIKSELCNTECKFLMEDDSFHTWWKMSTVVNDVEVVGTASRFHFYPVESEKEEDKEVKIKKICDNRFLLFF